MSTGSLEDRVKRLEEINQAQSQTIQRLEDVHRISNLVNRYEWLCHSGQFEEVVGLFAQKTPGVTVELGPWGVYSGIEGVKKLYVKFHRFMMWDEEADKMKAGLMLMNLNTTPVIEVAGDGKTAKGVWVCPGLETSPTGEGKAEAGWSWVKRAYDFVKEDGEWKFWHYHVYGVMMCSFYKSWADPQHHPADDMPSIVPDDMKADKPSTYHWQYEPTARMNFIPVPPTPYETFDEKSAY